jgi:adenosine deaminase
MIQSKLAVSGLKNLVTLTHLFDTLETFSHTIAVMQTKESIIQVARECAIDLAQRWRCLCRGTRSARVVYRTRSKSIDQVVEATTEGYKQGMVEAAREGNVDQS